MLAFSPLFSPIVQHILSLIAGAFILSAQIILIRDVVKKKIQPGLLSWAGWFLLMGTGLLSQILEGGWEWSLVGLLLSVIGCFAIFSISLFLKNYLLKKSDWYFLVLGLVCLLIYIASKDAWLTTGFAILADFIVGIPTLIHAYQNPKSQKTFAWTLGFVSWSITLLLCVGHSWLYAFFPVYLFLYNGVMILLTAKRKTIPPTLSE